MQMLYDSDAFVVVHMQANEPLAGEPVPRIVRHGCDACDEMRLLWTLTLSRLRKRC